MTVWATGDLPAGWAWVRLGEIADVHLGKMLDAKRQTGKHTMPYLRNINVQWHRVDLSDLLGMDVGPEERDRYTVQAGDLVVCEGGEPGRCAIVPEAADGMAYQKALHRVRPLGGVDARYLAYVFETMMRSGAADSLFTGSTIKHLPLEKMKIVTVPLAPAEEQTRIADALDEKFSIYAATLDGLRRLAGSVSVTPESQLGRLRRSLLTAAFQGLLSDRDGTELAAEVLVKQIAELREHAQVTAGARRRRTTRGQESA